MAEKICPRCQSSFVCTGESDCWCESVQLHKKAMVEIMELYTDCLCEKCLRVYEAKE
ncbi:MAG: cysteine-rich CWC family protein [Bacteroidota bacterium]